MQSKSSGAQGTSAKALELSDPRVTAHLGGKEKPTEEPKLQDHYEEVGQHGLTGWVVRKQKGHKSVSETAIMALEQRSQASGPRL